MNIFSRSDNEWMFGEPLRSDYGRAYGYYMSDGSQRWYEDGGQTYDEFGHAIYSGRCVDGVFSNGTDDLAIGLPGFSSDQGAVVVYDGQGGDGDMSQYNNNTLSVRITPNPTINVVHFACSPKTAAGYTLTIFDITGRNVRTLTSTTNCKIISAIWDLNDNNGHRVNSGVYLYELHTSIGSATGSIVVH